MNITGEKELAAVIDHTLLSPTATAEEIKNLCGQAVEYGFCTVFVNPRWVSLAAEVLHGTNVKVGSVAGFPLGADTTKIKTAQAKEVIFAGADEVDMVADIASIVQGDHGYLYNEISELLKVCRSMRPAVTLKVIIEAAALTTQQKIFACKAVEEAGADFVKTSTGFHSAGGASVDDVRLIKENTQRCKIKASAGIRTAKQAIELLEAGADRLGTSASVQIIGQFRQQGIQK